MSPLCEVAKSNTSKVDSTNELTASARLCVPHLPRSRMRAHPQAEESTMALTGRFQFRKSFWGRIVLQVEEEVKPFWRRPKPGALKRRWRDATLVALATPEMRPLIDMSLKPWTRSQSSLVPELASPRREQGGAHP